MKEILTLQRELQNELDPVRFSEAHLDLRLDKWQQDVLRYTGDRLALNCSRQSGKTTVAAIAALHRAIYYPKSTILIISPAHRQSKESYRIVREYANQVTPKLKMPEESLTSFTFENGSRVISLPSTGPKIRGYSVDLLVLDESSRIEDDCFFACRPMLSVSQGKMIALSTPAGCSGWWYTLFQTDNTWKKVTVPATQCKRIKKAFLKEEREAMGDSYYRQEYMNSFEAAETAVFRMDYIEQSTVEDFPLFPGELEGQLD